MLIGLTRFLLRDTEPRYRDVPLSQWLVLDKAYKFRQLRERLPFPPFPSTTFHEVPDVDTCGPEAPEAIRCIGTNAIPWLIKWMSVPRNSWKTKVAKSIAKLPRGVRPGKLPAWLDPAKDFEQVSLAQHGFIVLGPPAVAAISDLVKLACDPRALGAANAVDVLAIPNWPAIPELVGILTSNASKDVKVRVMDRLGYLE